MPGCAVSICNKTSKTSGLDKDGVSFHKFPKDPKLRHRWAELCQNKPKWQPTHSSTICSKHFDSSQFVTRDGKRRKIMPFAIPSLFLSVETPLQRPVLITEVQINDTKIKEEMIENLNEAKIFINSNIEVNNTTKSVVNLPCCCGKSYSRPQDNPQSSGAINQAMENRINKLKSKLNSKVKVIKSLRSKNMYLNKKMVIMKRMFRNVTGIKKIPKAIDEG